MQKLFRFDLDLRPDMAVSRVAVDALAADFRRSGQDLVVTAKRSLHPHEPFLITVNCAGKPGPVIDPDGSLGGWIPTDDGAFVWLSQKGKPTSW